MKVKAIAYSILAFFLTYFGCFVLENIYLESYPLLLRILMSFAVSATVLGYFGYKSLSEKIEDLKKWLK